MFKKLMPQQMGFVNLQLIIMITLVIVGIGAVGSYVVLKSKALTPPQIRLISKLEPSAGSAGSKIIIYGDRSLTDTYKININETMGVAKATSKDGGKSLLFTFPASLCPMGQTCNQAAANPGWYTISVTDSRNQTSNSLDFNLVETTTKLKLVNLVPSIGPIGTKVVIYGDRSLTDTYKININGTMGVAKATSKDGGKSLLFTFPASLCPMGQTCNQAAANPGWYTISVTDSRNQTSYTRDFNLEATTNH